MPGEAPAPRRGPVAAAARDDNSDDDADHQPQPHPDQRAGPERQAGGRAGEVAQAHQPARPEECPEPGAQAEAADRNVGDACGSRGGQPSARDEPGPDDGAVGGGASRLGEGVVDSGMDAAAPLPAVKDVAQPPPEQLEHHHVAEPGGQGGQGSHQEHVGAAVRGQCPAGDHHHLGRDGREDGVAQHDGDDPEIDGRPPAVSAAEVHCHKVPHIRGAGTGVRKLRPR
jgi:hypothetical protein